MTILKSNFERFSIVSNNTFDDVVADFVVKIGHPAMAELHKKLAAAQTEDDLKAVVESAIGVSGLMEFARFDLGEVLRKENPVAPKSQRFIVGNPLIMRQMVKAVHDAGSYVPVTILIDERQDGVHLSYDRIASFLSPYGDLEALKVAKDLDSKVEALLSSCAGEQSQLS
jgi:uncharacterized protein (DUF302 family)